MDGQKNARLTHPAEPEAEQTSSGPRFARFVAAIAANPPRQVQLLEEVPRFPMWQASSAKAAPPVPSPIKVRSGPSAAMPWFGIGCWALFSMALVASLLHWPDRDTADDVIGVRSDRAQQRAVFSHTREAADYGSANQLEMPPPSEGSALPFAATMARRYPDMRSATRRVAEEVVAVREPAASDPHSRVAAVPPRPRLKPPINHVASATPFQCGELAGRREDQIETIGCSVSDSQ